MEAVKEIHSLAQLYSDGLELLGNGLLSIVEEKYQTASGQKEKRVLSHLKIKFLISNGKFSEAISLIKKTRAEFGDHISLVSDLASLYYSTYQYALWNKCVQDIESILSSEEVQLSKESYSKTVFLLAKFQEEQGAVSKSYASFQSIKKDADNELELRINANLLRLDVFYGISKNVSLYYHEIKQLLNCNLGFNISPEILHALLLAELELFGVENLEQNLLRLIPADTLDEDQCLIYIDVTLLLAKKSIPAPLWLIKKLESFTFKNMFEQKVFEYVSGKKTFCDTWIEWSSVMPLGNFFHLALLISNSISTQEQNILQKQVTLLTKHLPPIDQKYWRKLQVTKEAAPLIIKHKNEGRLISVEDIEISLSNKKILYEVLVLASVEKKVTLPKVAENIFNSEFNSSYYHRIRRLVKRVNDEFENKLLPPPLICDKDYLSLCKKYQ